MSSELASQNAAAQLAEALAELEHCEQTRGRGLAEDIHRYVLLGTASPDLWKRLADKMVARELFLPGSSLISQGRPNLAFARFYACADQLDDATWTRWLDVLGRVYAGFSGYIVIAPALAPPWLEPLLFHQAGASPTQWSADSQAGSLHFDLLQRLLTITAFSPERLIHLAFSAPLEVNYGLSARLKYLRLMPGYGAFVQAHTHHIRPLLAPSSLEQRQHALDMLRPLDAAQLGGFAAELADAASATARAIRNSGEALLLRLDSAMAIEALIAHSRTARPEQRQHALRLAWRLSQRSQDVARQAQLRDLVETDPAPSVQDLLQEWRDHGESQEQSATPAPMIDWASALDGDSRTAIEDFWKRFAHEVADWNQRARDYHAKQAAAGKHYALAQIDAGTPEALAQLLEAVADPNPGAVQRYVSRYNPQQGKPGGDLKSLAVDPRISLPALLKTIQWFHPIVDGQGVLNWQVCNLVNARYEALAKPALDDLFQALIDLGVTPRRLMYAYATVWGTRPGVNQPLDQARPFFLRHLDEFVACFNTDLLSHSSIDREVFYRVFSAFPAPPKSLLNAVFALALGSAKTERVHAQAALDHFPAQRARIVAALGDGKAEVRTIAANWLARLRHEDAIAALAAAVRVEKNDVAKGAQLDALQALGQPVGAYIDRAALLKEARKQLAKPLPKELAWISFDHMPTVVFDDSGEPVEADLLRHLIASACRLKSPEPHAVMRKQCELFRAAERERLGQWLLDAWIAADTRAAPYETVTRQAAAHAQSMHRYYNSPGNAANVANDPKRQKSVEELTGFYLPQFAKNPVGTEIASKGVLALVAACAGAGAALSAARYLKDFYGTRAAHCKALIQMLAWVEHPSAVQLLLSVGKRFRTKGIQDEANKQASLLAERKGWTMDELADRTIPTGGLDDAGVLELDYGPRCFSARLRPDYKLELLNAEGKVISALPDPRQDDDAELAQAAKKQLAAARKEIKTVIDQQGTRLFEAMCTGRSWRFEEFERYLLRHPLVGTLAQRLVWCSDDAEALSFRPLADGSLTDRNDNAVHLPDAARIVLAHSLRVGPKAATEWQQHLADYEVTPLFAQFAALPPAFDEAALRGDAIESCRGVVLDAFSLRGRAGKLGYVRALGDGAHFDTYEKHYPNLGLRVAMEFSGNELPETNRKVALTAMRFFKGGANGQSRVLALADVPPVLLAESRLELARFAADGHYVADWEKQVGAP